MVRINGRRENSTGGNTHYRLTSGKVLPRGQAVNLVKKGGLSGYHIVKVNDREYLRDNPDQRTSDNIDSQPII